MSSDAANENNTASVPEPSAADSTLTLSFWEQRWTDGATGWHEEKGNDLLWKHLTKVVKEAFPSKEPKDLKVFVPLCGKTKDMYLMYQSGFTVVGVEFAAKPIMEFFEENEVPKAKTQTAEQGLSVYSKSADGRIILGRGDLFQFQGEPTNQTNNKLPFPKYDIIWDRGSFEAMNFNDRSRYAEHMKSLLADDGVYLLEAVDYNIEEYRGPPLAATMDEIAQYYGPDMSVERLEDVDNLDDSCPYAANWKEAGLTRLVSTLYLLKKKEMS